MTYYLTSKNSMGYESRFCTNRDWVGSRYCRLPTDSRIVRCPTVKTWSTEAGAKRWLAERPGMEDYATVTAL